MAGFIYEGSSTSNIIGTELILVSLSGGSAMTPSIQRDLVGGDPTISRHIVNEYGTITGHLEFEYGLIKANGELFTIEEQIAVETWLTSPKFSSYLTVYDCDGVQRYRYFGKFTSTEWLMIGDGYGALNFVFSVNGSYASGYHTFTVRPPQNAQINQNNMPYWATTIACETDELEEWIYPKLTVSNLSDNDNVYFEILNSTDNNGEMKVDTQLNEDVIIDCKNCIIKGETSKLSFRDLGWQDIGNIYWLRLKDGNNLLRFTGNVSVKIEYDSPLKVVGGWLI